MQAESMTCFAFGMTTAFILWLTVLVISRLVSLFQHGIESAQ